MNDPTQPAGQPTEAKVKPEDGLAKMIRRDCCPRHLRDNFDQLTCSLLISEFRKHSDAEAIKHLDETLQLFGKQNTELHAERDAMQREKVELRAQLETSNCELIDCAHEIGDLRTQLAQAEAALAQARKDGALRFRVKTGSSLTPSAAMSQQPGGK